MMPGENGPDEVIHPLARTMPEGPPPWARVDAPSRAGRPGDSQGMPTKNDHLDIQSMVISDIEARRAVGIERYGTALQPFNGRSALLDAYEEVLDLAMYLKQKLVEDAVNAEAPKGEVPSLYLPDPRSVDGGTKWSIVQIDGTSIQFVTVVESGGSPVWVRCS